LLLNLISKFIILAIILNQSFVDVCALKQVWNNALQIADRRNTELYNCACDACPNLIGSFRYICAAQKAR
jgi:hypothetical protein